MSGLATKALHADQYLKKTPDVAPAISVSNTFEYPADPHELKEFVRADDVYSRCTQPNVSRAEAVLSALLGGPAIAYANGIAAFNAVVMALGPKRVFVDHAYYGILATLEKYQQNGYLKIFKLEEIDEKCQSGDLVHLENPQSPWGTAIDVASEVARAHARGGIVCLDATIAPPPIFAPFDFGVNIVMHSGSKYLGGHSDVLVGVVAVKDEKLKKQMVEEREHLGSILPTFQAWLLLRSLRTLSVRVRQQVANAEQLVHHLASNAASLPRLKKVYHTSLQNDEYVRQAFPHGGPATFGIEAADEQTARELPNRLQLFVHATSMGGVESSVEWRALSDSESSRTLVRVSVGIEDAADLIADFENALRSFD